MIDGTAPKWLWAAGLWLACVSRALPAPPLCETRETASPANDECVGVNPPPLLWPAANGKEVRYAVRLAQDPQFPPGQTIGAEGLRWAMFNAHQKLAPGTWHWQVGTSSPAESPPRWSAVFRFQVGAQARPFVTPPAERMLAACPAAHPRALAAADQLPELRRRLAALQVIETYARQADRCVKARLPDLHKAQPKQEGDDAYQRKNFAKWASKAFAGDLAEAAAWLAPAYLATGQRRYAEALIERGLFIAELDPAGVTAPAVSDFADGSCMRVMALAYDTCYDLLSPAQRAKLCAAMQARAGRFYAHAENRLETKLASAHIWQHILMEFTEVALAARGDLPDADRWLAYVYELWLNRFPVLGGDDGGWAEGISYFGTNSETLLFLPGLWGRLTGVSFFDHPWYRQAPYFHLYVWPPGSASDGFGDGAERDDPPRPDRGVLFAALAGQLGNPHARWYADRVLADKPAVPAGPLLTWRGLTLPAVEHPAPRPPTDLPLARAFRDVGIVSMHTDLTDVTRDLMIGFRSSSYGAYNHAHACQNAFNLNFGGRRLFANSGYYIAYGDEHFRGWYTHTRGHNCVLIDGQGQAGSVAGYGSVERFLTGREISYCLGDASHAYGDAGLTRFRRHLALLRPNVVVVYDELAADHPAQWSWLLHSPHTLVAAGPQITVQTPTADARASVFGSTPLHISIDDRFDPPAVNWRGKKAAQEVIDYPNQWHATAQPAARCPRMRYLAALQIAAPGELAPPPVERDGRGRLEVGPWRISAEVDATRPASLLIERVDGQAALAADHPPFAVGGRSYECPPAGAVLIEAGGEPAYAK